MDVRVEWSHLRVKVETVLVETVPATRSDIKRARLPRADKPIYVDSSPSAKNAFAGERVSKNRKALFPSEKLN